MNIPPPSSGSKSMPSKKAAGSRQLASLCLPFAVFLLGLLFGPEDGGDIFFQNVKLSPHYTASQPRISYSSVTFARTSSPTLCTSLFAKSTYIYLSSRYAHDFNRIEYRKKTQFVLVLGLHLG
jgi:hypothetical protein